MQQQSKDIIQGWLQVEKEAQQIKSQGKKAEDINKNYNVPKSKPMNIEALKEKRKQIEKQQKEIQNTKKVEVIKPNIPKKHDLKDFNVQVQALKIQREQTRKQFMKFRLEKLINSIQGFKNRLKIKYIQEMSVFCLKISNQINLVIKQFKKEQALIKKETIFTFWKRSIRKQILEKIQNKRNKKQRECIYILFQLLKTKMYNMKIMFMKKFKFYCKQLKIQEKQNFIQNTMNCKVQNFITELKSEPTQPLVQKKIEKIDQIQLKYQKRDEQPEIQLDQIEDNEFIVNECLESIESEQQQDQLSDQILEVSEEEVKQDQIEDFLNNIQQKDQNLFNQIDRFMKPRDYTQKQENEDLEFQELINQEHEQQKLAQQTQIQNQDNHQLDSIINHQQNQETPEKQQKIIKKNDNRITNEELKRRQQERKEKMNQIKQKQFLLFRMEEQKQRKIDEIQQKKIQEEQEIALKKQEQKQLLIQKRKDEQLKKEQKQIYTELMIKKEEKAQIHHLCYRLKTVFKNFQQLIVKMKQNQMKSDKKYHDILLKNGFDLIMKGALLFQSDKDYMHTKMVDRFRHKHNLRQRVHIIDILVLNKKLNMEYLDNIKQKTQTFRVSQVMNAWKTQLPQLFQEKIQIEKQQNIMILEFQSVLIFIQNFFQKKYFKIWSSMIYAMKKERIQELHKQRLRDKVSGWIQKT